MAADIDTLLLASVQNLVSKYCARTRSPEDTNDLDMALRKLSVGTEYPGYLSVGTKFDWWSLTRKLLKRYLTEKQNGCLQSGRLREVFAMRELTVSRGTNDKVSDNGLDTKCEQISFLRHAVPVWAPYPNTKFDPLPWY